MPLPCRHQQREIRPAIEHRGQNWISCNGLNNGQATLGGTVTENSECLFTLFTPTDSPQSGGLAMILRQSWVQRRHRQGET